jgi:hypothetical protein
MTNTQKSKENKNRAIKHASTSTPQRYIDNNIPLFVIGYKRHRRILKEKQRQIATIDSNATNDS